MADTFDNSLTTEDDAGAAFVYQEALRGQLQQQAAVQSVEARAATLIFAGLDCELAPRRPRARRRRGRLGLGRPIAAHGDRRSGGGPALALLQPDLPLRP